MMVLKKSLPLAVALITPASFVAAHPGHDHGHWASPAVHSFLLVALASAIVTGIWFYLRRSKNIKTVSKEK
jgi:predicted secreted protein